MHLFAAVASLPLSAARDLGQGMSGIWESLINESAQSRRRERTRLSHRPRPAGNPTGGAGYPDGPCFPTIRRAGVQPPRGGAAEPGGDCQRAMASLGVLRSGSGSLGLLVWLLALQPWLSEALVGGEGAQGRSALPSPSPPTSGGSRKDPGARRWKLPPPGAPGTPGAPESRLTSVAPNLVAFTLSDSDSYKDVTPPQAPGVTKKPAFPSGDVS